MTDVRSLSYRDAGVDLDAADRTKEGLRDLVESTRDANTLSEMGLFAGLYAVPAEVANPVLVSSADGVGTKLKIAFRAGRHDTVGQDLVNHCVNDILVQGARPLFFLDYLATGDLDEAVVKEVVSGVAVACRENGCALLGGETAQMPDFYRAEEYDLAGFIVGVVERERILDGSSIGAGDTLIGIPSSGLHTNGYTLARRILFDVLGLEVDDVFPGQDGTVAEVLLTIHASYRTLLSPLLSDGIIKGLAHITGGGIPGNLPRTLGPSLGATIELESWTVPETFRLLAEAGRVEWDEMFRVFNMGVGMIAVAAPEDADSIVDRLSDAGTEAWVLGSVHSETGVSLV